MTYNEATKLYREYVVLRINELIDSKFGTAQELAKNSGISPANISRIRAGDRSLTPYMMSSLFGDENLGDIDLSEMEDTVKNQEIYKIEKEIEKLTYKLNQLKNRKGE